MRRVSILIAALALSTIAACERPRVPPPAPIPTPTASPTPGTGGWCGDGTILRPGEQCP